MASSYRLHQQGHAPLSYFFWNLWINVKQANLQVRAAVLPFLTGFGLWTHLYIQFTDVRSRVKWREVQWEVLYTTSQIILVEKS